MEGPFRFALPGRAAVLLTGLAAALLGVAAFGIAALLPGAETDSAGPALARLPFLVMAGAAGLAVLGIGRFALARPLPAPPGRDALTGLLDEAGFRERLEESVSHARRHGCQVGVLALNLRHFRDVNAAHGRGGGDAGLRIIAARLRAAVRLEDQVARLAGDRFAVVQTALAEPADTLRLAERLAAAVAVPLTFPAGTAQTTADIGIAIAPADGTEAGVLLTRAEEALATARAAPAPAIRCFAPEQDRALRARRQLERELRQAIAAGDFELHWQPQRRLFDSGLIGFEALLRWRHATRGTIPPDEFIPLAEATGLIVPLGAWVIRTAAAEAARWPGGLKVAVNLSAVQVKVDGLIDTVAEALAAAGLPPHRLELEVTESVLIQDSQQAARVMAELQGLGVTIALDDFGTGWSSLAYLRRFPFNELKIDRQFLRDLDADPRVETVVTAILGLGRGLGMRVVAEGIETREQADRLIALGCERGQGWLLGRPMPIEQARALIEAERAEPQAA